MNTETEIQLQLYKCVVAPNRSEIVIPNTYNAFPWEADLVKITASHLTHEFEIKNTLSDFRADQKKVEKHEALKKGKYVHVYADSLKEKWPDIYKDTEQYIPNYFWYVCVGFEPVVPEYAGLIVGEKRMLETEEEKKRFGGGKDYYWWFEKKIQAPRIHREKLPDSKILPLFKSVHFRYWEMKGRLHGVRE